MTSFQAASSEQGRQFAEQCDSLLERIGFELRGPIYIEDVGVQIDQEATRSGNTIWFEYKGSVAGNRPGLRRTDTLKKAVANGALLKAIEDHPPYVILTSHLPNTRSGVAMLEAARTLEYFADVICIYDPAESRRLKRL